MGVLERLERRASSSGGAHPRDPVVAEWWGGGAMSSSGYAVTPDTAMRISAVFACVRVLAEAVAGLPLKVFRRLDGGGKSPDDSHPLRQVLHRRPNAWQSSFEWREMGMAHMCLRGAAYSRILVGQRGAVQLTPMHPDRTRVEQMADGRIAYEYHPPAGARITLVQEEVLRIPFMVLDGVLPVSPIGVQRDSLGVALAARDYVAKFFKNDATPRGIIEFAGMFRTDEDRAKFLKSWQDAQTGENRHRTAVLQQGMSYKDIGLSNQDAQLLDTLKFSVTDIARIYRVPPHMIGDLERATFSNIEHQSIDFVVHTLAPWLVRWEQALARDLLPESQQETHFIEFNVAGLLRGDIATRYRAYATGRQWGWLSANDVRSLENMNPIDGGATYLSPVNMTPADQLETQADQKETQE